MTCNSPNNNLIKLVKMKRRKLLGIWINACENGDMELEKLSMKAMTQQNKLANLTIPVCKGRKKEKVLEDNKIRSERRNVIRRHSK